MKKTPTLDDFYAFRVGPMFRYFFRTHFAFWMICIYLFFEYFRPQSIYPAIDFFPWARAFVILAFLGALLDPTVKWVSSPVNKWIIAFSIVIYISSLLAYFPEVSREYFVDFYSWVVIYFLIVNIVNTRQRFYIFLMILMFCSAKIAIGTTVNWAARGFRFTDWGLMGPRGFFQNSGELAILMLCLFPLAFYYYRAIHKKPLRWWERALMIVFIAAPIMTILGASSRGSQLALLLILALMYRKHVFRIKPMVAVAFVLMAAFYLLPEQQKERFTQMGEDRTSQQRILYFQNGWEMMKKYPVFGVGYFNFPSYFALHYPEDIITYNEQAELSHNIFIQVGTDAGFVGLAVFIGIIVSGLRLAFRIRSPDPGDDIFRYVGVGLGYGLIGFAVAGQFVTVAYYPFLWIGVAFIAALNNVVSKAPEAVRDKGPVFAPTQPVAQR